ncbi:MAG: formimidoylglutamase [Bacteroidota bacterium]|jgi:formiminoglutamase
MEKKWKSDWDWKGRVDLPKGEDVLRFHQIIEPTENLAQIAIIGYAVDYGVELNQGRIGAAEGPSAIRKNLASLPVHFSADFKITDLGDVSCEDRQLRNARAELSSLVEIALKNNSFPLVLGGGHDMSAGTHRGIKSFFGEKKIGIINFDAHFDLRSDQYGSNSGTPFYEILTNSNSTYMAMGIQPMANTKRLFDTAKELDTPYFTADDLRYLDPTQISETLNSFISWVDHIHLSVDLDVFGIAFAPGVSAPSSLGLMPEQVIPYLKRILNSGKVVAMDIAELNPVYDIDQRTSKLAAAIVFEALNTLMG